MLHKYEVTFQRLAETKMSIARLKPRHSTLRGIHIHLYVIDVTLYNSESTQMPLFTIYIIGVTILAEKGVVNFLFHKLPINTPSC